MGLFTRPGSHIDRSTGRNKRDKSPLRRTDATGDRGGAPERQLGTGKVINRAEWRRNQKTRQGRTEQPARSGGMRGWVW
jgi:hypothetical protein